ncbi:MAG: hypothetical protein Q9195_001881 [Heterodermia aff. obscurata]
MSPSPAQSPWTQTPDDNSNSKPSHSQNPLPIEERNSWFHKIKKKCSRVKEPKASWAKTLHKTTQHRRTSGSEEVFGRKPHAPSGFLNGVATATEHPHAVHTVTENDSATRSRILVCLLITEQSLLVTNGSKPISSFSPTEQIIPVEPSDLRTTFKMVIHMQGDQTLTRMVQLDTGSSVDLLSELVTSDLGKELEPYDGQVIPLGDGEPIRPLGKVTLDWHVMGKPKTYTTTFLVLDEVSSEDFDVLLSRDTIGRIGFYKTDDKVWVLSQGSR